MRDQIEAGALFVVAPQDMPGGIVPVGGVQHLVPGPRVIVPALAGGEIHGGEFPLSHGVLDARLETPLLFLVVDFQPVFDEQDAIIDDVSLYLRADFEKALMLLLGAEAHHRLDARAVVPTAVEDDHLPSRREVGEVTLDIYLGLFPVGWCWQGDDAKHPRTDPLGDGADAAAFARGVATLEDDDDPLPGRLHPILHQAEFGLELAQGLGVFLESQFGGAGWAGRKDLGLLRRLSFRFSLHRCLQKGLQHPSVGYVTLYQGN